MKRNGFHGLNTVNGRTLTQTGIPVSTGEATWKKPVSFGTEIALYVKQTIAVK